ncbi:MAG: hypothetical protein J0H98_07830 [Solirubrobacterales bacterium]|nr:hypothetical protein [Solirubrobacterales bacterium]
MQSVMFVAGALMVLPGLWQMVRLEPWDEMSDNTLSLLIIGSCLVFFAVFF